MFLLQYFALLSCALAANVWSTYPTVPKTASVNGFADPILGNLPECAKNCVGFSTGNTPCPYWDTGCLCVMPQWSGQVAACFISSCTQATDLASATAAAYSLCSSVGANMWLMPASLTTALEKAVGTATVAVAASSTGVSVSSGSQSAAITSAPNSTTSAASSTRTASSSASASASTSLRASSANAGISLSQQSTLAVLSAVLLSFFA